MKRFNASDPCPVCGGHDRIARGQGQRCGGFLSEDGLWAHCTREEFAGGLAVNDNSATYAHRLSGTCRCGTSHGGGAEVRELGEARGARIVATYDYTDESGALLYQVVRKEPKTFLQRRPDGDGGWNWSLGDIKPVPFRLPQVLNAVAAGDTVWIVEGEKDVISLEKSMQVATCNSGGAGKWQDRFARYFEGANVVIVRDKDEPGHEHARQVFRSLRDTAASVRVVEARTGKDATDHLGAGHSTDDFVAIYPVDRSSDPQAWKRSVLRNARDLSDRYRALDVRAALEKPLEPTWPTGLEGRSSILPYLHGVTILTGGPSAGKSFVAIGSAAQAALSGWDVLYLSSEMGDRTIAERLRGYFGEAQLPKRLHVQQVSFGADLDSLIELCCEHVSERRLLVVFDSLSSFIDQANREEGVEDVHRIGPLKRVMMWAVNVRRQSDGEISFLLLSETNAQGQTKGRFGDHKADLVVSLKSDEDEPKLKELRVVKGWRTELGVVGVYRIEVSRSRLLRVE